MRISRVYLPQKLQGTGTVVIDGETAHYLSRVLRLGVGDLFNVFNDNDGEFCAEVIDADRKKITARLVNTVSNEANPALLINLGLGLSKGERMDWAIQKSTELGVGTITPLFTSRCEVRISKERLPRKIEHWQKVAISASEQCGRSNTPSICPPLDLGAWLNLHQTGIVLDHRGTEKLDRLTLENEVNLLIGPEGGLSEAELDQAIQHQFSAVRLGPRILRTETAPVVALSLIQHLFGDI